MQREDDVVCDRQLCVNVERGFRYRCGRPELYNVELPLGRGRDSDKLFGVGCQNRLKHRMDHKVDRCVTDVRCGDLLAPRAAVFILGHLPDRANALSHEEEVSAFKCLSRYLGDDAPELLGRPYFCNQFVVREAPVILAGSKYHKTQGSSNFVVSVIVVVILVVYCFPVL